MKIPLAAAKKKLGAAGNMLLGSVATKVLHISTIPVLLVR